MKAEFKAKMKNFRLQVLWSFLRGVTALFLKIKFGYRRERCREQGPCIILCNHNTDWDPLLLGQAFRQRISFVASEHIFRWGFTSKLIRWGFDPIARLKGTVAVGTVRDIVKKLKAGTNVAIFAEGNRSFNGLTGEIPASTGKLVRLSGAKLVTYKLSGGYFTSPRWSSSLRRGRMEGSVVNVYPAETLKKMSADEINEVIRRDLFVDAVADQRKAPVAFRGKGLAEHLERILCLCPKCRKIGTLVSHDDRLSCACGFNVRFNEYGFFEGEDAPFDNVTDWDLDQTEKLKAAVPAGDECIFSDTGMVMKEVHTDHTDEVVGSGKIALFRDHLECCGVSALLKDISGFMLRGPQTVNMSIGEKNYEISSESVRCMRKYMTLIEYLQTSQPMAQN